MYCLLAAIRSLINITDIKPFENSLSRSVHPCTLLDASFCGAKTSPLDETTDIPVRSETTRREHKLTAGSVRNVHPCTFLTCEICIAQISFLRGTTAIRGGTDTLRTVFSSGETLVKHPFSVSLLQIGEVDPRREKKLTAGVSLIR